MSGALLLFGRWKKGVTRIREGRSLGRRVLMPAWGPAGDAREFRWHRWGYIPIELGITRLRERPSRIRCGVSCCCGGLFWGLDGLIVRDYGSMGSFFWVCWRRFLLLWGIVLGLGWADCLGLWLYGIIFLGLLAAFLVVVGDCFGAWMGWLFGIMALWDHFSGSAGGVSCCCGGLFWGLDGLVVWDYGSMGSFFWVCWRRSCCCGGLFWGLGGLVVRDYGSMGSFFWVCWRRSCCCGGLFWGLGGLVVRDYGSMDPFLGSLLVGANLFLCLVLTRRLLDLSRFTGTIPSRCW